MYLIYIDESGNTGKKLDDLQQPMHFLVAVFVSEYVWLSGYEYWRNQVLSKTREIALAANVALPTELHATDVYQGTRMCRGIDRGARNQIIRSVLEMLRLFDLQVVYAVCDKRALALEDPNDLSVQARRIRLMPGMYAASIYPICRAQHEPSNDPGAIAWGMLLNGCQSFLGRLGPQTAEVHLGDNLHHGVMIADRGRLQGFARRNVRASLLLSATDSTPRSLDDVLESQVFVTLLDTVHFVDSRESPYIQLTDFVAYFIMRAWRAGNWEGPGPEPHYDEFIQSAVRGAYRYPAKKSDG